MHKLFEAQGIQKGDKIALVGKNSANWACMYLATVTYGAVIVPLLQDFKPIDIYNLVNHSESKLLFGSKYILDDLQTDKFEALNCIYTLDDCSISHNYTAEEVPVAGESETMQSPDAFNIADIPNDQLAAILYTSGTSGLPKGVMLDHNTLAANIKYAQANMPLMGGDPIVSFLPLAHSYGCAFEFLYPFSLGCSITFMGKAPSPNVLVKAFKEIQPRLILSVPLVIEKVYRNKIKPELNKKFIRFMLKMPLLKNLVFNKVRKSLEESFGGNFKELVIGGAKLNREAEIFLHKIGFRFANGYGMTECGPLISYDGWKTRKRFSAGKIIDTLEARIDSEDPQNKPGEILLKGENMMLGYYKNEEQTKKVLDDEGWLHTGDLGQIDADGFLFIKGRSKSMILGASGKNIYPEEIESKLSNYPLVGECLVVGRQNKIVAKVYPNHDKMEQLGIEEDALPDIMMTYKKEINEQLPAYMNVHKIQLREEEFKKTPKRSIKRFLYN